MSSDPTAPNVDVRQVPPATLTTTRNIRSDLDLDAAFRASIRELGVLSPIVAETGPDGGLMIRSGHRRAAAAALEGVATVPVLVLPADSSDQARLTAQIAENTARRDLTTADLTAGHEQLARFGVPIEAAAAATGMTTHDIIAARAVATAPRSRAAATERQLSLTQAATLAEFEGEPELLGQLLTTLDDEPDSFEHHAQSLRDERARDAAIAAAAHDFTTKGYTVLDRFPDRSVAKPLYALRGDDNKHLSESSHAQCPGRAVTIRAGWTTDDDGNPETVTQPFCTQPSLHNELNPPGVSGDSTPWEGWSHVSKYVQEVSAGAA